MIRPLAHRGVSLNDKLLITGFYWYIEDHYDPRLSKRHFIKSLDTGVDYEVDSDTIEFQTGYTDANNLDIYDGDQIGFIEDYNDITGNIAEKTGAILYDPRNNAFYFVENNTNEGVMTLDEVLNDLGGYIV